MALERLSQITESGIKTGITLSNASVTGVLTAVNELKVGTGVTINSGIVTATGGFVGNLTGNVSATGASTFGGSTFSDNVGIKTTSATKTLDVRGDTQVADLYYTADYPTIRPSLDLVFDKVKRLDSRVTFTRNSVGTYVGTDGLIKTAAANEPRFDHDPITGESLGFLIEEQRTNLFTYSEQFDNSAWSKTRTTVSANSITAPDGTLTADKIIENVGSSQDYILDENVTSSVATYTYSFFAKAGERKHIRVSRSTGNQTTFTHYYTLEDSGTATGGGNIESYANDWYRCYGQTEVTSAGNAGFALRLENSSTNSIYDGDGTSGFYIWGAQYEQGAFPTSYIPTSGSAVTRNADFATILGNSFDSFYNTQEWTVLCDFKLASLEDKNGNCRVWDINNNTNNGRIGLLYDTGSFPSFFGFDAGATQLSLSISATGSPNLNIKTALGWSPTSTAAYYEGTLIGTDNTSTTYAPTQLQLGNWYNDDRSMNGTISKLAYYGKRLTNAQLQLLTQ